MLFRSMWEPAKTDEEYREKLKRRRIFVLVMVISGAASIVVSVLLIRFREGKDFISGFYMGLGLGILAASVVLFLKIRNTLQDEKKLRMKRLKEFDERNIQLTLKAHYTAGLLLVMTGYVIMLVSAFFSMQVFWTVWGLIMLYFVLFTAGRFIYERKM